jgi:hypothetical protein
MPTFQKQLNTERVTLVATDYKLEVIRRALGISNPSLEDSLCWSKDPVLIAIDTENMSNEKQLKLSNTDFQFGIAIFNPQQPNRMISTYNFVGGSAEYYSKVAPRFLFGKSVHIKKNDIGVHVKSIFPESRDAILIGHSLQTELLVLESLSISLPFTCGVDTQCIAKEVMPNLMHPLSLSYLGKILGIPMRFLHCVGNDAHFTLMALLGLACLNYNPESDSAVSLHKNSLFQTLKASISDIKLSVRADLKDPKKQTMCRQHTRLENERNREAIRASRIAEKQALEEHDWSTILDDINSIYYTNEHT